MDLMIALEALFVKDGSSGEIGYKFRMRIAKFLGTQEPRPAEVARQIAAISKIAYDTRSAIVHGDFGSKRLQKLHKQLVDVGIENFVALTERIEEYARRSIRLLLRDSAQAAPDELDDRLLS